MTQQTDMRQAIAPKSDQLNYEDFLGERTLTIKITTVTVKPGAEQPVTVNFEGDNKKPYKPSKTMGKVICALWGDTKEVYFGRSLTLYGDPTVLFGGAAVGGIKISHMSNLDSKVTMMLTSTRGKKAPHTVHPLVVQDALITREQQKAMVAAMGAIVTGDQLLKQFKLKNSGEITADQYPDVMVWIGEMKEAAEQAGA